MKNSWDIVMRMRTIVSSVVLATALIAGCSGGGSSGGGTTTVAAPTGTVTGQVASATNNAPVAGATVSTTAGTTTSAADGSFTVAAGTGDRTVVHVEATGFAEAFPVARVTAWQTTNLGVRLVPTGVVTPVMVATGGIVTVPNSTAQVDIPADGLVPKSGGAAAGTVNVAVTPINPTVDVNLMPGDFMAVSAGGGTPAPIESFGALLVDIRDNNGTRYNLAAGKTSTIRIPVGTNSAVPPVTIPLFFFNETTGLWVEEGSATLRGTPPNQYYEGTVTHFSYWNADQYMNTVFISGCVRDPNSQPLANVPVRTNGIDYTGTGRAVTAADGTFRVAMRRASLATLSALDFDGTPLTNTINVGPFDVDTTLPACLVTLPVALRITTQSLPAGTVGVAYNTVVTASNGTPPYSWSRIGPLPDGLEIAPSTGAISGTPTTAGTTTVTIQVQDSATPTQSATKQFTVTIFSSSPGGGGGTLSLTGAPGSTGGAFVSDPQLTQTNVISGFGVVVWSETPSQNFLHFEAVGVSFDLTTGELLFAEFINIDSGAGAGSAWVCYGPSVGDPLCSGVTVNRTAGTVNFASTVVTDIVNSTPPITLSGTLNFTPF